ncbi:hypothetical protein [Runella slithyformis]|uniref:Uncharacterized protein n=1 Tax=Runella slithyformis (strain ATCC 29530 / DSM 19594 / LMG 11500 / NCIMB 11436 / LSU 4) TaxID=761193 RepID=A0A7U4E8S3_RUNSL|nr:hypothetical protein [Runella slithyformis]AEI51993.1 hypothetical protein Runsl_5708 [Runella slithyformis DSM 19594]
MPNQTLIAQLEEYKRKERFMLDHWEDREVEPSHEFVIEQMRREVIRFTDFLIDRLAANASDLHEQVERYFKEWDNDNFNYDETEFIVETEYEAMRMVGLNIDDLLL